MPNAQSINHNLGLRLQALILAKQFLLEGRPGVIKIVEQITGLLNQSIYRYKAQACARGFDPKTSPRLFLSYIEDKDRPGRPTKIIPKVQAKILANIRKDRNSREITAA